MADQIIANTGAEIGAGSEQGEVLAPYEEPQEEHASLADAIMDMAEEGEPAELADDAASAGPDQAAEPEKAGKRRPLTQRFADVEKRGYEKGRTEAEREWQARLDQTRQQYEARLAKLEEIEIRDEAQQLAKDTNVNLEFAIQHVKLSRMVQKLTGAEPQKPAAPQQPEPKVQRAPIRDESGKFTAAPDVQARAQSLMQEAQQIRTETGLDVLGLFQSNEAVRKAVASGGMSFRDIAAMYGAGPAETVPAPQPRAVRTTASERGESSTIHSMSDEAFRKLNEQLSRGHIFNAR